MARNLLSLCIGACTLVGCGGETPTSVESVSSLFVPEGHLVEMIVSDDIVYVANSGEGFTVARIGEDAALSRLVEQPEELWRCTTLALHRASETLYCAAEDAGDFAVHAYDVSDPAAPALRFSGPAASLYVDDIAVIDDRLFVSRFDEGLSWLPIDEDGRLGAIEDLPLPGADGASRVNVRSIDEYEGDPLVLTTGTRLVRIDGETLEARDEVELEGPPLDLAVGGSFAAVALGSPGVALVDLRTSPPSVRANVHPAGVATAVDFDAETLVVATLTGVFAYAITEDPASVDDDALIGFFPASGAALDVQMRDGQALVSNWTTIEHLAFHPTRPSLALDLPFGVPAKRGEATSLPVRNPGPSTVDVRVSARGTIDRFELGPGETHDVELSAKALARAENDAALARVRVRVLTADDQQVHAEPIEVTVQFQPERTDPAWRPMPGDPFPPLALDDENGGVLELPLAQEHLTVFHALGCAAMWPELEDLAWLARHDDGAARPLPVFVAEDPTGLGFYERYDLRGAQTGYWGFTAASRVHEANAEYGTEVFHAGFEPFGLPGPNPYPADYLVGADGMIERFDRLYYGAHQP